MLCEECQNRKASFHFTKIINGKKTEFHICDQCAKEKGELFPGMNNFSIHQLLSGLLHNEPLQERIQPQHELVCSKCEMTYEQFTRVGRFGCAHCYTSFGSKLDPILRRVHSGNTRHHGKLPARVGGKIHLRRKIEMLKEQLQLYVEREEFEKAAEVRDEIRLLEQQHNEMREE